MARYLAAIKLKSLWNTLRGQTALLVLSIVGYAYGLVMVGLLTGVMIFVMVTRHPIGGDTPVVVGAAFTLGWVVVPVIFASQDSTLDAKKLAPFLAPSPRLAWGLLLATGVGFAGIYLGIFSVGVILGWAAVGGVIAGLVALLAVALGVFISVTWSRVAVSFVTRFQTGRRARERAGLFAFVLILAVMIPMGLWVGVVAENFDGSLVGPALRVLRWTPFGAPWALPWAVQAGQYAQATGFLLVSVGTAVTGWWLWLRALPAVMYGRPTRLGRAAVTAIEAGKASALGNVRQQTAAAEEITSATFLTSARRILHLGVDGPTAATAERTWLYWLRDPRLSAQLISVIFLTVVGIAMTRMNFGVGDDMGTVNNGLGISMLGMAAFLTGTTVGALLQYDSTALWVQVAAGIRGWQDRLGRLLGSAPLVLGVLGGGAILFGVFARLTGAQTLELFTMLACVFVASYVGTQIIATQWIYPVQAPGTSPLSTKQTGEFWATMLIGVAQFAFGAVLVAPSALILLLGVVIWPGGWRTVLAVAGAWVFAAATLTGGIYLSGRILDRTQVELLTKMAGWPGHRVHP